MEPPQSKVKINRNITFRQNSAIIVFVGKTNFTACLFSPDVQLWFHVSSSSCRSSPGFALSFRTTSLDNLSDSFQPRPRLPSAFSPPCASAFGCTRAHFLSLTAPLMGAALLGVWSENAAQNTLLTGAKLRDSFLDLVGTESLQVVAAAVVDGRSATDRWTVLTCVLWVTECNKPHCGWS